MTEISSSVGIESILLTWLDFNGNMRFNDGKNRNVNKSSRSGLVKVELNVRKQI